MSGVRKKVMIDIGFNTWGGEEKRLNKEWIDYRIAIFMDYTLKSLKAQTDQDFETLVFYDRRTKDLIEQALSDYDPLPDNIKFTTLDRSGAIISRSLEGYDDLYYTYLASDDMLHKTYIRYLKDYVPKEDTVVLIPQYGYAYDSVQDIIGRFFFYAPSFCTIVYHVKDYLQGKRYKLEGGWTGALKHPHEIITKPAWINHIHGCNTALGWGNIKQWTAKGKWDPWLFNENAKALFGPAITDKNEINEILKEFIGG